MAYWLYQHLGNLSPPELAEERLHAASSRSDEDGGPRLRDSPALADRESAASRCAFHRDFGRSRLVVDRLARRARARRRPPGHGRRRGVAWIAEHAQGAYDHLIIASTLPVFMTPGIHDLEAWNEAVCAGRLGRARGARRGEAAARARPRALAGVPALVRDDGRAARPARPGEQGGRLRRTITLIGGDVHTAYVAEVALGERQGSRVYQVVCSPFRNPLGRTSAAPSSSSATRGPGHRHAVPSRAVPASGGPTCRWQLRQRSATFDNSIAVLDLDERACAAHHPAQRTRERRGPAAGAALRARSHAGLTEPSRPRPPARRSARPPAPPRFARSAPSCGRRRRARSGTLRSSLMRTVRLRRAHVRRLAARADRGTGQRAAPLHGAVRGDDAELQAAVVGACVLERLDAAEELADVADQDAARLAVGTSARRRPRSARRTASRAGSWRPVQT